MENRLTRDEIETIVLQAILSRPYKEIEGYRIYSLKATGEEEVIKHLKGTKTVETLTELEEEINSPATAQIYIDKYASITTKGMMNVLSRTSLVKEIFCAFELKD